MKLLTISNLYPRPDRPQAGLFNAQLFRELGALLTAQGGALTNVALVPDWRPWRHAAIRRWVSPFDGGHPTRYLPACYVPLVGRDWNDATYALSLRGALTDAMAAADVVFSSWLFPDGVVAARLARAARRPAWLMALGSDVQHVAHPRRRARIVEAADSVAGMICVGAHLAERLHVAGVAVDKLHVVPNGVDTTRFQYQDRDAARRQLQGADVLGPPPERDAQIVLFVGNLVSVKAPDVLIAAFAAMHGGGVHAPPHLVLIGTGPLERSLRRQCDDLGVTARVHLVGPQDHARVAQWMNAADCLCLCSRSEGMPNVVLEALASGLPVVATAVGSCPDMLRGEPAARLVPVDDEQALAQALRELLTMSVDRAALAARHGHRRWRDQAADILALMQSAPPLRGGL